MMRREFPKAVKRDAFVRAAGRCEGHLADGSRCASKLTTGKFAYDHVNPDGLTGEPTLANCAVLCVACHGEKTKVDVANIARAKRRQDAHLSIRPPSRLKGAPFPKAPPQRSASKIPEKLRGLPRKDLRQAERNA